MAPFSADILAARQHLTILGSPVSGLFIRGAMQVIFLSALIIVFVHNR